MIQKVLKIGSSAGVTIPAKSLEELGLKVGDEVQVEINSAEKAFTVKARSTKKDTKELHAWTSKFIEEYKETLEILARK